MVNTLNEAVRRFWPCPLSESIGYLFCPCSCGLSFCLPNICIKEGESALKNKIDYYNEYRFIEKGLTLQLVKKCSTSWIEVRVTDPSKRYKN
jgi:hypothetical protein